jgi:hypothetical protein
MNLVKSGPGRPRKYGRSSRPVTMTLPDDVIARLRAVDSDLGRAIVAVVERGRAPARRRPVQPAELASYGSRAVIVVTPVKALTRLAGVQLVPIGNGRALISLDHPQSIPQLELAIGDAIEREGSGTPQRRTLEAIAGILREARRSRGTTLEERTIIVLRARRRRSPASPRPAA